MTVTDDILTAIRTVRSELLQEAIDHGCGRSPRRGLWLAAADGWVPCRELHGPMMTGADRQRFSRTVRGMVAAGELEATRDDGGRILEVRVPPAPETKGKRR